MVILFYGLFFGFVVVLFEVFVSLGFFICISGLWVVKCLVFLVMSGVFFH